MRVRLDDDDIVTKPSVPEKVFEWFMVQRQKIYICRDSKTKDMVGIAENRGKEHGPKSIEDTDGQVWYGIPLRSDNTWDALGPEESFADIRTAIEQQLK